MSDIRLIDANALKAKIQSKYDDDDAEFDRGYNIGLGSAVDLIDSAPTLPNPCGNPCNFIRPTGKWVACTKSGLLLTEYGRMTGEKWYGFKCSRCRYIYKGNALIASPYCQRCGAKMKEAEND